MDRDTAKSNMIGVYEHGYGDIPKKVMQDRKLSIESKAIYAYISSFAGAKDNAFPSVKKMMYDLKISKDRFYKHMNSLVESGYLVRKQSIWKQDGQFTNNDYFIIYDK